MDQNLKNFPSTLVTFIPVCSIVFIRSFYQHVKIISINFIKLKNSKQMEFCFVATMLKNKIQH